MKRCPTCKRIFTDSNLSFCTEDGTPLAKVIDDSSEETVVNASGRSGARADGPSAAGDQSQPAYEPPRPYSPPNQPGRRRAWPWIVGILAFLLIAIAGLGIAAAVFVPRMLRAAANDNSSNTNVRSYQPDNVNANSNANTNANSNVNSSQANENGHEEDLSPPPTNDEQVLAQLTDLEHDWTVANINADKKKLDRILADDYVGKSSEGKPHGKAEYLKTIEPDNTIQKWNFEDLKVSLIGARATLTGIIRLQVKDEELAFNFTDKFVWRDGRWQATGSEVTPIKQ
ncbi:MAG: nuclear transport factor 2 family protein [Blastocatellia bacterium]|nr:nuclear transport factor 2 family protein [Blastocatellia bacterium]